MIELLNREVVLIMAFIGFIGISSLYLLFEARKDKNLKLTDLVTGDNGRYASSKFYQAGAFFSTTWAFLYFVATGKADTTLLLGYAGVWATAAAATKAINVTSADKTTSKND